MLCVLELGGIRNLPFSVDFNSHIYLARIYFDLTNICEKWPAF